MSTSWIPTRRGRRLYLNGNGSLASLKPASSRCTVTSEIISMLSRGRDSAEDTQYGDAIDRYDAEIAHSDYP